MTVSHNEISFVFMDESGNKENDRFFVCGFLEVVSPFVFHRNLFRIYDQVYQMVQRNRIERSSNYKQSLDVDGLYNLARKQSMFELKFEKVTLETVSYYKDILKALASKCDFRFKAVVLDRDTSDSRNHSTETLYKSLCHCYFDYCQNRQCIFVPDQFDPKFDWEQIIDRPQKVISVLPAMSHGFIPLQIVDLLTGIVRLGLEVKTGTKPELGRNDSTRIDLVKCFEEVFSIKIDRVSDTSRDVRNYLGIWTLDPNKIRPRHAH
ncbi:MAG: DUF3800 domain-containing protein [Coriobacteriia bacterium]|nr:DUF3800 domain-containing protein [Coriobacteriia bacterium]